MVDQIEQPTQRRGGRAPTGQLIWRKSGWYGRITTTIDGERVRVSKALGTDNKAVAKRKLARLLESDNPKVEPISRGETCAEACERVYLAKQATRPQWASQGLSWLRRYIVPTLGKLLAADVKAMQIHEALEQCRAEGLSRQTVKHVRQHASNVFRQLVKEGVITVNPVEGADMPDFPDATTKERAVLTDAELAIYLTWEHPHARDRDAARERQVMACVARMFGGLRTGDLHALRWESFNVADGAFDRGFAPRQKTRRPQLLEVPAPLRPILRDHWERAGRPAEGLVFPVRRVGKRGDRVGEQRIGVSHAAAFRRDLARAFKTARERGIEAPEEGKARWRELFTETAYTLPVDFHSWRRAFAQALADAEVNAQTASALAGHADLGAHMRYLRNSGKMRSLPEAALPRLTVVAADSSERHSANGSEPAEVAKSAENRGTDVVSPGHVLPSIWAAGSPPEPKVTGSNPLPRAEIRNDSEWLRKRRGSLGSSRGWTGYLNCGSGGGSMALVTCPDCAREVSDAAPACPQCGRPMAGLAPLEAAPATSATKRGLILKDSAAERGKRLCVKGRISEIAVEQTELGKVYIGGIVSGYTDVTRFVAVGNTGELVENSRAELCGVVTGRYSYSNVSGGVTHAPMVVGLFYLR